MDTRYVEIYDKELNVWIIKTFMAIKKGDRFRLYEPDGTLVITPNGTGIVEAVSNVYVDEFENELVDVKFSE